MSLDLSWRPESYWSPFSLLDSLSGSVSGTRRREILGSLLEAGEVFPVMQQLLNEHLQYETRKVWGAIHPSYMGGEYLPERKPGEVEIARLDLKSVTADAISVRAYPTNTRIYYRIVNEYDTKYTCRPRWSKHPLNLGQLIDLINSATSDDNSNVGLVFPVIDLLVHEGSPTDEMRRFFRVHSEHYPALEAHFETLLDAWRMQASAEVAS